LGYPPADIISLECSDAGVEKIVQKSQKERAKRSHAQISLTRALLGGKAMTAAEA